MLGLLRGPGLDRGVDGSRLYWEKALGVSVGWRPRGGG